MMGIIGAVLGFILKAIGFVLLFVLAVLVIVLITPIKIGVIYPELTVYVKWNGIKYTILPMKKKDKKDDDICGCGCRFRAHFALIQTEILEIETPYY